MISPDKKVDVETSSVSLSLHGGTMLNLWSAAAATETTGEYTLCLAPNDAAVIGRQEGGEISYLDPAFRPTQMVPGGQHPIVASVAGEKDLRVSRGHFMLKGAVGGIVFVNGVPRRGGGIRPPINGTVMLEPEHRPMIEAEELQIDRGTSLRVRLPNELIVLIVAN